MFEFYKTTDTFYGLPQNNTCRMFRKKFVNLKLEASNLKLF